MSGSDSPVIVFSDDPLPIAFASLAEAEGYIEAIDVINGEYEAVFTPDGRVVDLRAAGNDVVLTITASRDPSALRDRLRSVAGRGLIDVNPNDGAEVVSELLRQQWEARWPKRPRWLDRRLHGDPPSFEP